MKIPSPCKSTRDHHSARIEAVQDEGAPSRSWSFLTAIERLWKSHAKTEIKQEIPCISWNLRRFPIIIFGRNWVS